MEEQKLRHIIREIIQEVSVGRDFLIQFADALEDLTGREAFVKASEQNTIRYDGRSNRLDIHVKSSTGNRLGGEVELKLVDARGMVRTGIDVPSDPEIAAEKLARELEKINENLRSVISEEMSGIKAEYKKHSEDVYNTLYNFVWDAEKNGDSDEIGKSVAYMVKKAVPPEYWDDIKKNIK